MFSTYGIVTTQVLSILAARNEILKSMDPIPPAEASSGPASRQKSCNACVRSKRKCDKQAPTCSRCAERDEPCVYKRRRLAQPEAQVTYEVPEHQLLPLPQGDPEGGGGGGASINTDNSATVTSPTSFLFSALSPPFDFGFLDFSDTSPAGGVLSPHAEAGANPSPLDPFLNLPLGSSSDSSMWITHGQHGLEVERPGTPVSEEIESTYEKMGDLCVSPACSSVQRTPFFLSFPLDKRNKHPLHSHLDNRVHTTISLCLFPHSFTHNFLLVNEPGSVRTLDAL